MTKKFRYILITAGFAVFLILAPLFTLYVRGVVYDFKKNSFVKTGILAIKTEPKEINIFLDGKLKKKKSGNIKFLKPKEYQIELKKEGYFDWSKKLIIEPGQVTWAGNSFQKLYLLKKNSEAEIIGTGVLDYQIFGNNLVFLNKNKIVLTTIENPEKKQTLKSKNNIDKILSFKHNKAALLDSKTGNILIADFENNLITNLNGLFASSTEIELKISENGQIFVLENNSLFKVNFQNPKNLSKTLIASNILTFSLNNEDLYYIKKQKKINTLFINQAPYTEEMELVTNLPEFEYGEIITNFNKEIFLLADEKLYKISNGPKQIANGINSWNYGTIPNNIIFSQKGELLFYEGGRERKLKLITRSQQELISPKLNAEYDYAFMIKGSDIVAIELDNRDHQNEYVLYEAKKPTKISVDKTVQKLVFLDGQTLKVLDLR